MNEEMTFRPMRRFKQATEPQENITILQTAYRGFLSVIGDGGRVYFHCAKEGHKLDAIRACDKACFTVLDNPVKEPGDWWFHVTSVICFGRVRILSDEAERNVRLRQLGLKYFPETYDLAADMKKDGPHAEILEFTIEHCTGKRVREK